MKRNWIVGLIPVVMIAGCGARDSDIQRFVHETDKAVFRQIEPLPAVKPLAAATYEGFEVADPFKQRRLAPAKGSSPFAQEINRDRRREVLEGIPLDQLKMVGTISQGKDIFALVRGNQTIYKVVAGDFMGQDFGRIVEIASNEIKLRELVQDAAGEWVERLSTLSLQEDAGKQHA